MKTARVRKRSACVMELVACLASNQIVSVQNCNIQHLERSSCQAELLDHEQVTLAITAIMSSACKVEFVRLTVISIFTL